MAKRTVFRISSIIVGVKSSGSRLKSECADIFHQSLISACYAILTNPKEGETAVYGYNPALF